MASRGRSPRSRKVGTRERHVRALVVCGGVKTEPQYFDHLKSRLGAGGVQVVIAKLGRSPKELVEEASRLAKKDAADARKSGDSSNTYDSVWIVTDVDDFGASVAEAVSLAEGQGFRVAVSNPCFELWLAWHVTDCGHGSTSNVQEKARAAGVVEGKHGKTVVVEALSAKYEDARGRAQTRRMAHERNGVALPDDNPSSSVDVLVDSLVDSAKRARPGVTVRI